MLCKRKKMKKKHKHSLTIIAIVWIALFFAPLFVSDVFDLPVVFDFYKIYIFINLVLLSALPAGLVALFLGTSFCIGSTRLGRLGFRLFATPYDAEEFDKIKDHPQFTAIFSAGMFLGIWIILCCGSLKLLLPGVVRGLINWLAYGSDLT